jgi:hypothetical protein
MKGVVMVPIFMIGTQRSGSNLLRLMLNQLSEVASPHPPHIFERIHPLLYQYGDLLDDQNFAQLVDDVCKLIELNPVEWQGVNLDRKEIISRCNNERSLAAIYGSVYDIYAKTHNAKTWCCKSLVNIHYIDVIEQHFECPKYIYLFRDGRDVALSFQKAVVGEKHIYNIAKDWARTQEKAIELMEHIDPDRVFRISYEHLTKNTPEVATSLCKFIGVKYTKSMMDFYKTSEARNAASSSMLWGNVTNPIMSNNSGKYKTEMPEEDICIFESVAGHVLDKLGYKRELIKRGKERMFTQSDIESFNHLNSLKKSEITTIVDKHDIERRERQSLLINEIKSRICTEQCAV